MCVYRNLSLSKDQISYHLQIAAKSYNLYADRVLLFVYQKNIRSSCELLKVFFGRENFMHLVGIRSKNLSAIDFFTACLNGSVSFEDCSPSHDPSNRNHRILLLPQMLDFSNCKIYNIAEKDICTLQNDFQIASGNQVGIIGFDYRGDMKSKEIAIPTTLLDRPLTDYCTDPKRILFVYEQSDKEYHPIYEIKTGLYDDLVSQGRLPNITNIEKI